jgi:phosphohistidine phosphatase
MLYIIAVAVVIKVCAGYILHYQLPNKKSKLMKNLTLIRHAATHTQQVFECDKDRNLTERGHHQVENIAQQLQEMKCFPDHLLCSPARRTMQTATLLCEKLKINPTTINLNTTLYAGDIEDILESLYSLTLYRQVFLIGHNPILSGLAHKLCSITKSIILPTAGVISLGFDIKSWDDLLIQQGKLLFFIEPLHE